MNELDRRIAVEIMGIKEPRPPLVFRPPPYSTSYEYAMKAVDKFIFSQARPPGVMLPELKSIYAVVSRERPWAVAMYGEEAYGTTLPEAICNLLLALKEKP